MNNTQLLCRQFKKQFYRQNKRNFSVAIAAMVLLTCGNLLVSWLLQQIIDVAAGATGRYTLAQLCLFSVATTLGIVLALLLQYHSSPLFVKIAMRQYKDFAFKQLTKKSIHSFTDDTTSTYVSALSNDATMIETKYLAELFSLIQSICLFLGAIALMLYYSPFLTMIAFLLSLVPVIASLLTGNRLVVAEKEVSDCNARYIDTLKDMLSGFSVIKSFRSEKQASILYGASNLEVETAKCKKRKAEILILTFSTVAGILAQFGVFLVGAYMAVNGKGITAGVVIVFVQLMNFLLAPISNVPQVLAAKKATDALLEKMASAVLSNVRKEGEIVSNDLHSAIELKDLSFSYEANAPVLKNLNLRFEVGKSYAIVGGSGSGKSTLLNLLIGGYEDYSGSILYDTNELRSISSDSLYRLVSIVQQNVFIFNSSLHHNITMFQNFDAKKLFHAIDMSGLTSLINERGSDYPCGENGNALSGGERQRISIARCLLRETPVLLVDEATAALDTETAFSITSSILDIRNLTRIIVTHRLEEALLRKYDQIIVLKDGQINACGTFDDLMGQKDYFYSLYTIAQ